ncbi:hypothetical protein H0O00_01185 [Candidatus Micrarchaeota archaeon]|nr:hypothetical protein [Candidatus Micrarchaeota archaeon]
MVSLDFVDDEGKARIISMWKGMSESDKAHFINQVALAMSIWGSDEKGRRLVVEVLRLMTDDGTQTLADFGLYVDKVAAIKEAAGLSDKIKRATVIIEGYRVKNSLSSEPHRELF